MNRREFLEVRHQLGKTQKEMAGLLCRSLKGIQSFEQGWRDIPAAAERELLLLTGLKKSGIQRPCWSVKKCPEEIRQNCPVWEFQAGHMCWYFSLTLCKGKAPKNWKSKINICRRCEVFQSVFGSTEGPSVHRNNPSASTVSAIMGEAEPSSPCR